MRLFLQWTNRKEYSKKCTAFLDGNLFVKGIIVSYVILLCINPQLWGASYFLLLGLKKEVYQLILLYFAGDSELQLYNEYIRGKETCISTNPSAWIFKEDELHSSNWQFPKSQYSELWIEETDLDFAWYIHVFNSSLSCLSRADCIEDSCCSRMRCFFPHYACNVCMSRILENRWKWHSHVFQVYS